jgi:hypothetical protein
MKKVKEDNNYQINKDKKKSKQTLSIDIFV